MKRLVILVGCLAAAAFVWAEEGATLRGRVALPAPRPVKESHYAGPAGRAALPPPPPIAAILLEGGPAANETNAPPVLELAQEGYQFRPGLLVVRRGSTVRFPNRDSEYHNVLSYSRTKEFDLGRFVGEEDAPSVLFDKAGVVEVNCEIHPHMRAFVLVVDTPWFTTTDPEGRFELQGLPPGRYQFKAWSQGKVLHETEVVLSAGAEQTLDLP